HGRRCGDDLQPRIARPLPKLAHIGAVDPGYVGKILLGDAPGVTQPANWQRKPPEIPAGPSGERTRRPLLAHRSKATKSSRRLPILNGRPRNRVSGLSLTLVQGTEK